MMATPSSFDLGPEAAADGRFVRQESVFRRWVTSDGSSELPVEAGRYHLYVSLACPWSHRAVIVRAVKGLQAAIGISYAAPFRDQRGWAFTGEPFVEPATGLTGAYTDPVNGFRVPQRGLCGHRPRVRRTRHRPRPVGQGDRSDRQQRIRRHRAHVQRRLRPGSR